MPRVGPSSNISTPPTAGPTSTPRLRAVAFRRTALCRVSLGTMSCSSIWLEVCHSTPAQPCSTSNSMACHICSVSVRKNMPQPSEAVMNSAIPIWIRRRGSKRSDRAPAGTANSRNGSQCDTTAKPPSAGEWNFCQHIQ